MIDCQSIAYAETAWKSGLGATNLSFRVEVSVKRLHVFALIGLTVVFAPAARADLNADSPVKFPKDGALPPRYLPDRPVKDGREVEPGTYVASSPEHSLEQVKKIQADMPAGQFKAPPHDWTYLPRTRKALFEGGSLHIVALGDSIINDTMPSGWTALLQEAYPRAKIARMFASGAAAVASTTRKMAASQGMWARSSPISSSSAGSARKYGKHSDGDPAARQVSPAVEILLTTGAGLSGRPIRETRRNSRKHIIPAPGPMANPSQALRPGALRFLEVTAPWAEYLRSARIHPHHFYRDVIHANEFGEQVIARIYLAFFPRLTVRSRINACGGVDGRFDVDPIYLETIYHYSQSSSFQLYRLGDA